MKPELYLAKYCVKGLRPKVGRCWEAEELLDAWGYNRLIKDITGWSNAIKDNSQMMMTWVWKMIQAIGGKLHCIALHWMRVKSDNSIVVSLFANRLLYVLWPQSSSSRFTLFHTTTISHWQQIHLLTLTTNILSHIRKYENQPGCRDSADCWKVSIIIILQFSNLIIVISQREREAKKHYKRAKLPWLHFYFGLLVSYFCVLSSF